jgi:DNA polymerase-4
MPYNSIMVDTNLPSNDLVRYLFLDLNSYFASVEQQEHPELRGKPIAVVPVQADTTFVIAASYEAKAFGIKTGTRVDEAKRLCPDLILTEGTPPLYVYYHDAVLEAVQKVLPIERVCSIDEMRFRLLGEERQPDRAVALATRIKNVIREEVGTCMKCSVGVAPNAFLAKVGTEMQKPDGLVLIRPSELPQRLWGLRLTDFPGINRRMEARINAAGVFTAEQLTMASPQELRKAFGSIVGEKWWSLLRGMDTPMEETPRKTLSHSHVMAPELRTDRGAREVLLRLIQKASARLRAESLVTEKMEVFVTGKPGWSALLHLPPTNDTTTFNEAFLRAWERRDFKNPLKVAVVFSNLETEGEYTPSLFDEAKNRVAFCHAIDEINQRFGKNTVYLAGMRKARHAAPERIAFDKTWLFKEGKDDNVWPDTFRGGRAK